MSIYYTDWMQYYLPMWLVLEWELYCEAQKESLWWLKWVLHVSGDYVHFPETELLYCSNKEHRVTNLPVKYHDR